METTKKFYANDTMAPIVYRPGTSDESIIQTVLVERREYIFPNFKPKVCYDIGGNIGVVAVIMANIYPDATIVSFEPDQSNFNLLKENAGHYKNIKIVNCGLAKSTGTHRLYPSEDPTNLGGFSTKIRVGEGVLQSFLAVDEAVKTYGVPDLIKIDCEGAEDEILTNMPNLPQVRWITGELHGINDYLLLSDLEPDFHLQLSRNFKDKVWHFHALNKTWTDFGLDPSLQ